MQIFQYQSKTEPLVTEFIGDAKRVPERQHAYPDWLPPKRHPEGCFVIPDVAFLRLEGGGPVIIPDGTTMDMWYVQHPVRFAPRIVTRAEQSQTPEQSTPEAAPGLFLPIAPEQHLRTKPINYGMIAEPISQIAGDVFIDWFRPSYPDQIRIDPRLRLEFIAEPIDTSAIASTLRLDWFIETKQPYPHLRKMPWTNTHFPFGYDSPPLPFDPTVGFTIKGFANNAKTAKGWVNNAKTIRGH